MMFRFLLLSLLPALCRSTCIPVSGERILAGDMARAVPAFADLSPDLILGYVPVAGTRRTFTGTELGRLARRYGVAVDPGTQACFVSALETLDRDRVMAALIAALPAARIELLDFSRQPVPSGELHFPPAGLAGAGAADPQAPFTWRGTVESPGPRSFPIWARVRIHVKGTRVTAAETLPAGQPIQRSQLRVDAYDGPPGLPDLSRILQSTPRRTIPAGAVIQAPWLEEPQDVRRGEPVQVEVFCGRTRLRFEAQAQSSARRGQVISVRNPASGRILRARVEARGRVVVAAGSPIPNEGEER